VSDVRGVKPVLTIDGSKFTDLDGFAREFSALLTDWTWTGNLDAFNDILGGGFGTPERDSCSAGSTRTSHVGHSAGRRPSASTCGNWNTAIQRTMSTSRTSSIAPSSKQGPTLFDLIVEIIESHGPDGSEPEDDIKLELL
jgi:hypothetical protein